jgi:hypothetical protein
LTKSPFRWQFDSDLLGYLCLRIGDDMAEFSPQNEIHKVWGLVEELFRHVLHDEEPLFISDEATLWDVSMSDPNEILARCVTYYGVPVSMQDTRQPLWRLLPMLDERRRAFSLRSDPLKAVDDIRSAQQNVLVRDILKNAQRVDEVLWNATTGVTPVPALQKSKTVATN